MEQGHSLAANWKFGEMHIKYIYIYYWNTANLQSTPVFGSNE